jgi:hypothetical protein
VRGCHYIPHILRICGGAVPLYIEHTVHIMTYMEHRYSTYRCSIIQHTVHIGAPYRYSTYRCSIIQHTVHIGAPYGAPIQYISVLHHTAYSTYRSPIQYISVLHHTAYSTYRCPMPAPKIHILAPHHRSLTHAPHHRPLTHGGGLETPAWVPGYLLPHAGTSTAKP